MKKIYLSFACLIFLQLFAIVSCFAQSDVADLKIPSLNITVDGNLKDWGDSLQYFNAETHTRFALGNDKENLYFAIKIDDRLEALRVLNAGITLGVDPKGKKKEAYTITFPVNTQANDLPKPPGHDDIGEVTKADRDELARELITTLRGIKVTGFKDIEGDMITTSNIYGIKTAIAYDAQGNLICEASIALKLLHAEVVTKNEWVYDVKINGIARPAENANADASSGQSMGNGRGGRGGMGGGGRGGMGGGGQGRRGGSPGGNSNYNNTAGSSSKAIDFSGKFYLAQQ